MASVKDGDFGGRGTDTGDGNQDKKAADICGFFYWVRGKIKDF